MAFSCDAYLDFYKGEAQPEVRSRILKKFEEKGYHVTMALPEDMPENGQITVLMIDTNFRTERGPLSVINMLAATMKNGYSVKRDYHQIDVLNAEIELENTLS